MDTEIEDIARNNKHIRTKELSPVDVVRECLDRIQELNPALNAFITVRHEVALKQAKAAEEEIRAGAWRGPLHGIPACIKDFYDTAGIKSSSRIVCPPKMLQFCGKTEGRRSYRNRKNEYASIG